MATLEKRIEILEEILKPMSLLDELLSQEKLDDDGRPLAKWEKLKLLQEALDEINVKGK